MKDGGKKIYETVMLPADKFDKAGFVRLPSKEQAKADDEFFLVREVLYLKEGNPELFRTHYRIVRRRDAKTLGESVHYIRRGGDFPGPWHPSSLACPEIGSQPALELDVFVRAQS
jgi:hypothetical protein